MRKIDGKTVSMHIGEYRFFVARIKTLEAENTALRNVLTRVESRCMGNHKGIPGRQGLIASENFEDEAIRWFHTQAGKAVLWGASIVAAVLLTRWAGGVL